jgi:hypothetical protein
MDEAFGLESAATAAQPVEQGAMVPKHQLVRAESIIDVLVGVIEGRLEPGAGQPTAPHSEMDADGIEPDADQISRTVRSRVEAAEHTQQAINALRDAKQKESEAEDKRKKSAG